jgi:hypothetical protein
MTGNEHPLDAGLRRADARPSSRAPAPPAAEPIAPAASAVAGRPAGTSPDAPQSVPAAARPILAPRVRAGLSAAGAALNERRVAGSLAA